jgi:hypothetical protein
MFFLAMESWPTLMYLQPWQCHLQTLKHIQKWTSAKNYLSWLITSKHRSTPRACQHCISWRPAAPMLSVCNTRTGARIGHMSDQPKVKDSSNSSALHCHKHLALRCCLGTIHTLKKKQVQKKCQEMQPPEFPFPHMYPPTKIAREMILLTADT